MKRRGVVLLDDERLAGWRYEGVDIGQVLARRLGRLVEVPLSVVVGSGDGRLRFPSRHILAVVAHEHSPEIIPGHAERSEYWTEILGGTDPSLGSFQRAMRRLPSPPRCKLCQAPFSGPYAPLLRLLGFRRWALNQQICRFCVRDLEKHNGGAEIDVSLMYVDVRGSTGTAEDMNPRQFSEGLRRYLSVVSGDVDAEQGVIDHMAGDGVMAMWIPAFVGPEHPTSALHAAIRIARDVADSVERDEGWPAGVGVHTGPAYVGVVGEPGSRDFTVLGDTANTVARLSGAAAAGEVVLSQAAVAQTGIDPSSLEHRVLTLKGKSAPFDAWVWNIGDEDPIPSRAGAQS